MALLPSIIADPSGSRPHQPLILVQSSASQTCLPVLRNLIQPAKRPIQTLLICFLYTPTSLIAGWPNTSGDSLKVLDYTAQVPGYDESRDPHDEVLTAVRSAPSGSLHVIMDSIDTLAADLSSISQAYTFIKSLLGLITARSLLSRTFRPTEPSVLILHLLHCPLLPVLTQTGLSTTLVHIIAHPPALLTHLASSYLAPPPPAGSTEKFWSVLIPISERVHESEALVYGSDGSGTCSGAGADSCELVVELIVRGMAADGRRRTIERTIEAWSGNGPEHLERLESLKSIWPRSRSHEEKPIDGTQSVSFNLKLTPSQEKSRAQIPLPYAHEGELIPSVPSIRGAIIYEPDSADDVDDDDPDEDLDI